MRQSIAVFCTKPSLQMIVVAPNGGFGNRMRAMRCGAALAELLGKRVTHVWTGPRPCDAHAFPHIRDIHNLGFQHFFTGIDAYDGTADVCYTEWLPGMYWSQFQNYGERAVRASTVKHQSEVPMLPGPDVPAMFCIETSLAFLPMTPCESARVYNKYCVPHPHFVSRLPAEFAHNSVGISIRKNADFMAYFPGSALQVLLCYEWLKSLDQPVALFSDDKEFQREARTQLRDPIALAFETVPISAADMAFLEFLTLSRCSRVFGTAHSSFAQEAALFGNVPYDTL